MARPPAIEQDIEARWARPFEFSGESSACGSRLGFRPATNGHELFDPAWRVFHRAEGCVVDVLVGRRGQVSPLPYVDLTLPGDMRGMQRAGAVRTLGKQQRGVSQQNFEHPPANASKQPGKLSPRWHEGWSRIWALHLNLTAPCATPS